MTKQERRIIRNWQRIFKDRHNGAIAEKSIENMDYYNGACQAIQVICDALAIKK